MILFWKKILAWILNKTILSLVALLTISALVAAATIQIDDTSQVGSDSNWQTGLSLPSDSDADTACSITAGLPFSCTLPSSGTNTVSCTAVNVPAGVTVSSGCVMAGTQTADFSVEVSFDDGVSDALSKTINLTTAPNQNPTVLDPSGCASPSTGVVWSCSLAGTASDPELQTLSFVTNADTPSWASISNNTISGTPASSGAVAVAYSVFDGVNTVNHIYNITVAVGTAGIILSSDPVTASNLTDAGVSSDFVSALGDSGCGSDGTSNCLAVFNANKSSTACTLAGGASATGAQTEAFAQCVIVEDATSTASSVATTQPTATIASGCSADVSQEITLPSMCGYSAWRCYVTNKPSDWTLLSTTGGVNSGGGPAAYAVEIPGDTTSTGTVNLSVQMKLAPNYSDHLIKTVSMPVAASAAIADAVNGTKHFSIPDSASSQAKYDYGMAYDSCSNQGGRLASKSETNGTNGDSFFQPTGITTKLAKGGHPDGGWAQASCYGQGQGYPAHHTKNGVDALSCTKTSNGAWRSCNMGGNTCSTHTGTRAYTCVDLPSCPSN
ncbi:hypothetical protein OAS65_02120 [Methylophilaceae bacterium]|nr:hypothetical protein [Methylophilaceae bacterium]